MSGNMLISMPRVDSSLASSRGRRRRSPQNSGNLNSGGRGIGKKKKMKVGSGSPAGVDDQLSIAQSSSGGDSPPTHSDDSGSDSTLTADSPKSLENARDDDDKNGDDGTDSSSAVDEAAVASSSAPSGPAAVSNSTRHRTASIAAKSSTSLIPSALQSHDLMKRTSCDGTPRASPSARRAAATAAGGDRVPVPSPVCVEANDVSNSEDSSSSSNHGAALNKKRKADEISMSDGEQRQKLISRDSASAAAYLEPPPVSPLYGVAQRRQNAGEAQPSIPYDRPPLNKHGVKQVESFISRWVERDPDATELMQLHHMEAAGSQHHLKQIRKSLEEQMNHTKDLLKLVFDDRTDKIDPVTLAHLRDDSAMWLPRPQVPECGEDGCKRPMDFCETAKGDDNYENGCWECDKCDAKFDPSKGDAGCERWNCADCEYDMCQTCAGVTRAQFEAWDARVELLTSLEDLPKRWWLNERSDPTRRIDPAVTRKRRRTGGASATGGRKKPGAGARQIGAGASIGSTGSWTVSAAAAALAFAPTSASSASTIPGAAGGAAASNGGVLPGAVNMGPAIVGKAIEVQWGRKAEWFPGFVTEYMDGQHHVKYNNGENEWVSLYRDFDNGVEWQMLPQRSLLPDGEHGTSAPGAKQHDFGDYEILDGEDDEYADASASVAYSSSSSEQQKQEVQQARQFMGVHAMNGMFHASVRLWDRDVSLGFFDTALEAAVAHDQGMRLFYGRKTELPLNFSDGKKGAVERRVAALIAEKKHYDGGRKLGTAAAARAVEKGSCLVNKKEDAADVLHGVMNIPEDVAVTMIGASASNGHVAKESLYGRSRHSLCM